MRAFLGALALALAVAASSSWSGAATAPVVVTMDVTSATTIDATGCATGASDVTTFGSVLPNATHVTGLACTISFGSTNDSSSLRIGQQDSSGDAMWQPTKGALDAGWDGAGPGDGIVVSDMVTGDDEHANLTALSDGTVLVVGESGSPEWGAHLAKYLPDGDLDFSFSGDGTAFTNTLGEAWDVAEMPDGRLVLVGNWWSGSSSDATISILDSDGVITGFSGDGTDRYDAAGNRDGLMDVHVSPAGVITAVGLVHDGINSQDGLVVRYDENGVLDSSFNGTGRLIHDVLPADHDRFDAVHVYDDGSLVTAGYTNSGGASADVAVTRLTATGGLDPAFNGGTSLVLDLGASEVVWDIHVMDDGRILLGGRSGTQAYVVRLLDDGNLDPTFDGYVGMPGYPGNGIVRLDPTGAAETIRSIDVLPDGRIALAGGSDGQAMVARLTPTGALDSSLAGTGYALQPLPGTSPRVIGSITLADGDILAVGSTESFTQSIVLRWDGVPISQYEYAASDWDTPGTNMFGACLEAAHSGASTDVTTWQVNAGCTMADGTGDAWQPIPATTGDAGARIADGAASDSNATVELRFGVRTLADQQPGSYIAPIVFEVVAPAA